MARLFTTDIHGHRLPLSDPDVEKASFFLDLPETSWEISEAIDKFFDATISSDPNEWWATEWTTSSDDFVKPNKAESAILEVLHLVYDVYELDPKTWDQIGLVYSESHLRQEYTQLMDKEGGVTLLTPPDTDPKHYYNAEVHDDKHLTKITQTSEGITMSAKSIHLDGPVKVEEEYDHQKSMSTLISEAPSAFRGVQKAISNASNLISNAKIPTGHTISAAKINLDGTNEEGSISHPVYYNLPSGRESKDVIRDILGDEMYEGWLLGTSIKYLMRYNDKEDPIKDLKKSKQYLQFIIDLLEEDIDNA